MQKRKLLILLLLFGTGIGLFFVLRFYQIFFWKNTSFNNEYSFVFIDRDDNIDSLELQLTPLLRSVNSFRIVAEKKGYVSRVRSGKYRIDKGMGNNKIVNTLRSNPLTIRVVFNSQDRLENLAGHISDQIECDSIELLLAFKEKSFLISAGFTKENALAMYLPDSYDFFWDVTPVDFRKRMLNHYESFWNKKRRQKASAIKLKPEEVYVLASIIQKESFRKEEQNRIAGVYINRLNLGMKLQADPTIIYALKKETKKFDQIIKRVLYKDLQIKSPYNTYRYKGLPPGPVCMPELSAIEAVLNPEKHKYLYFVASPLKPGFHLFAKTLKEHNKNKKIYTSWLDKKRLYR